MKRRKALSEAAGFGEDIEAAHEVQRQTLRQEVSDHLEIALARPKLVKLKPIISEDTTALLGHREKNGFMEKAVESQPTVHTNIAVNPKDREIKASKSRAAGVIVYDTRGCYDRVRCR